MMFDSKPEVELKFEAEPEVEPKVEPEFSGNANVTNENDVKTRDPKEMKHAKSLAQPHRHNIELMQHIAFERGGKCLSSVYDGLDGHLEWECCDGHTWMAVPKNVMHHDSWCPKCKGNVGEELVRAAMVEAFGESFERTRREEWLDGLELDGYNPELKLAFEYQGIQHFQRVLHFHREEGQFEAQVARDARKRELCKNAGVALLEIPYKIKFCNLRTTVREMLTDLGFTITNVLLTDVEFFNLFRARSRSDTRLELAKTIAIAKGGICLATTYISADFDMPFKCSQGHDFKASLLDINQPASRGPRFCPTCGGTQKKSEDEIRARVQAIGYEFLGSESVKISGRYRRVLTVKCPAGHGPYEVEMNNLLKKDGSLNRGCSTCSHAEQGKALRVDISAWSRENGIWIVGEYERNNVSYKWRCSQEHVFDATYASLRQRKNKCRICLKASRST